MARISTDDPTAYFGLIVLGSVLIGLAVFVTPFTLAGFGLYLGFRLYRESPARAERIALDETMILYNHAIAGTRRLTDEDVEDELGYHLPSRMSAGLRRQLIDVGRRIYDAEGLSPDVPPPPLCNTIEGACYRDMIARLGQAGNDRNLSVSALHMISESLAAIARYAPAIDGELSVPITQFITKPSEAVEAVIAPYFQDNDYNHFKRLRNRMNTNFNATHRTNPIYPGFPM